ncbi:hypothetical protein L208DRAFT_1406651 [Tricholoma matsutake]|nr:hypothetical protein L208DRAFT_1406651 [Tricholoma matsutake 945]
MAPDPQCSAVKAAKDRTGLSYEVIAQKVGSTEQRITNICVGAEKPTPAEFTALAKALGITSPLPKDHTG